MDVTELTTYQALVYHSRANRLTKAHIEAILREHNLTMMQWSVLGFIKDAGNKGVRISDLASVVDTSLAFITNSVNALEAKGMVQRSDHETDNRAKLVTVTPTYRKKLGGIEKQLQEKLGQWLEQHVERDELETAIKVMRTIALASN